MGVGLCGWQRWPRHHAEAASDGSTLPDLACASQSVCSPAGDMHATANLKASLAARQAVCTTPCRSRQVITICELAPASWLLCDSRQKVVSLNMSETSSVPVRQGQQALLVTSHHPELPLHEPQHLVHC